MLGKVVGDVIIGTTTISTGSLEEQETYKPVLVTWLDSTAQEGWHGKREIEEFSETPPLRIQSLGWKVDEGDSWIVLAMSMCESKAGELLKIPTAIIESIKQL